MHFCARTGDGIRRAKAAGVHMGRPPKLTKHQQRQVLARLDRGETLTEIARSYAVSHMTISRIKAQYAAASWAACRAFRPAGRARHRLGL
jgi:DNA invertase Pin-like site-specific DNA recombinase